MIGDPYRVKKYWKKLLKMVKNAWESKLGVVYLHWRGLRGGGGRLTDTPSQKRHTKNLVITRFFRTFIFYHPTRDKGTLKQICLPKILFVYSGK